MGAVAHDGIRNMADIDLAPGRVALGVVRAIHEGRTEGKSRPIVLVSQREDRGGDPAWAVMGLTSKSTYGTGLPRIALHDWQVAGLYGPGFLWGGRLAILPSHDIHRAIGWISYADALEIRRFTGTDEGAAFLAAVAEREASQ
jgi:hypothetical protein